MRFWLLLQLLFLASGAVIRVHSATVDNTIKHVVILGLDGLGRKPLKAAMESGKAPNLLYFKEKGAYTFNARSVMPSVSYPNWYSILTASDPPFHGIDGNDWKAKHPRVISTEGACTRKPNLFTILRTLQPQAVSGAFYAWPTIGEILKPAGDLNVSSSTTEDEESLKEALSFLQRDRPALMFLYFTDIDETGHQFGYGREYDEAIYETDARIGKVIQVLKETNMFESTLIAAVTDHGRKESMGKYHGSFTEEEINTFWAITGPGIKPGYNLVTPIANYDLAPAVLYALSGHQGPLQWRGRPVMEIFQYQSVLIDKSPFQRTLSSDSQSPVPAQQPLWLYKDLAWEQSSEYLQCRHDILLVTERLWGEWDLASFGLGAFLGVIVQLLLSLIICGFYCFWKRHRDGRRGNKWIFANDKEWTLLEDEPSAFPLTKL